MGTESKGNIMTEQNTTPTSTSNIILVTSATPATAYQRWVFEEGFRVLNEVAEGEELSTVSAGLPDRGVLGGLLLDTTPAAAPGHLSRAKEWLAVAEGLLASTPATAAHTALAREAWVRGVWRCYMGLVVGDTVGVAEAAALYGSLEGVAKALDALTPLTPPTPAVTISPEDWRSSWGALRRVIETAKVGGELHRQLRILSIQGINGGLSWAAAVEAADASAEEAKEEAESR